MKLFLLCAAIAAASGADVPALKTVYLVPMPNGLDQYLAVQLTTGRVLQVVADLNKANVILTDHIGVGLEQTLSDLSANKADNRADKLGDEFRPLGTGSRGKGAFFLVDHNDRRVLWSTYVESKDSQPASLNRLAMKIVERLQKDLGGK
ncbi:MAG TPA: hypothetical protein VIY49_24050 [Bryobacteraceae bacterium]